MGPFHILLDEMGLDQMGLDQMGLDKVECTCEIWPLIIKVLTSCLFYRPSLSSRHRFKPDLRQIVYLLFISDIRERLAYEQHLSTYQPSDRDRRYYFCDIDGFICKKLPPLLATWELRSMVAIPED